MEPTFGSSRKKSAKWRKNLNKINIGCKSRVVHIYPIWGGSYQTGLGKQYSKER